MGVPLFNPEDLLLEHGRKATKIEAEIQQRCGIEFRASCTKRRFKDSWVNPVFQYQQDNGDKENMTTFVLPAERARRHPQRFFDFHFLTMGKPDPTKTPKILALDDVPAHALQPLSLRIPGLHTAKCRLGRAMCIGWNPAKVCDLAREIDRRESEQNRKEADAVWEMMMEAHWDRISGISQHKLHEPFGPRQCQGSYVVQCNFTDQNLLSMHHTEPEFLDYLDTLDIYHDANGNLNASFDFAGRGLKGIMVLEIPQRRRASPVIKLESGDDGSEFHGQEATLPHDRQVDFWAQAPHRDDDGFPHYSGHLRFTDDDCTQFVGEISDWFCTFDENFEFRGFKISSLSNHSACPEERNAVADRQDGGAHDDYKIRLLSNQWFNVSTWKLENQIPPPLDHSRLVSEAQKSTFVI
ncbi:hypothetical protein HDK90DRAFT_297985 [Phyllosticta capitalensis]|uniref:Uncharacterized protein n=1 Tax=Phyllosticta capitalensis TaxID=121624 RepID=A0ABR1YJX3_9PEZI